MKRRRQTRSRFRNRPFYAPRPKLGSNSCRAPSTIACAHLTEAHRNPAIIEVAQLPTPLEHSFDGLRRMPFATHLALQLFVKIVSPPKHFQGRGIRSAVFFLHPSLFPNSNGDSSEKGSRPCSPPSSSTPSISSRDTSDVL